jgi:hypothetical protein
MQSPSKIHVRRIGGGYYIASITLRGIVRSGMAMTKLESIERAQLNKTHVQNQQ